MSVVENWQQLLDESFPQAVNVALTADEAADRDRYVILSPYPVVVTDTSMVVPEINSGSMGAFVLTLAEGTWGDVDFTADTVEFSTSEGRTAKFTKNFDLESVEGLAEEVSRARDDVKTYKVETFREVQGAI